MVNSQSSLFFVPSNLNVFSLIPSVGIVFRKYQVFLAHELNEYNIFPADVPFLFGALIDRENGILQDELIKKICITKSAATRILQSLEERNFIYRTESKHSRRHKLVMPCDKIFEIEEILQSTVHKWSNIISKSISEEELNELDRIFSKITTNSLNYK